MLYFTGAEENLEPGNSLHAMADGTMKAIGQLLAALICNYGSAPIFLSTRIFSYIIGGNEAVSNAISPILDTDSLDNLFAVCKKVC